MAVDKAKQTVETGLTSRIQPWQAIFAVLTYALGTYGIGDENALILYGMILATLGFVMAVNYKHKEAVKQIIAPWLVEQLLITLSEYLPKTPTPSETPPAEPIAEPDKEKVRQELERTIKALKEDMGE